MKAKLIIFFLLLGALFLVMAQALPQETTPTPAPNTTFMPEWQCCTCGVCVTIQAGDYSMAWTACMATGQSFAWPVIAMKDPTTGIEGAKRLDGCNQMAVILGQGFDLCKNPCKK